MRSQLRYDLDNPLRRDHVYIHMSQINDSFTDKIPVRVSNVRTEPIIESPHLYKLAISKFSLSTLDLPVMMPKLLVDGVNDDINKLAYSFTLKYKTFEVQKYITYSPQDKTAPIPNMTSGVPLVSQDVSSSYYFLNSFQYFIDLLNASLSSAYSDLVSASSNAFASYPPYIAYTDGLLVMNGDVTRYDNALGDNGVYIYINNAMYELLNGFQTIKNSDITNGKNYLIQMINNGNVLSLTNYDALSQIMEYSSLESWCPVQSICICSNTLPIYSENIQSPEIYQAKQLYNTNSAQTLNILTNFSVDLTSNPTAYLPTVTYSTTNQYRYIDLMQSSALTNIDLTVLWRDHYDRLHTLYLLPQTDAHFDVVFISRNLAFN